MNGRVRLDPVHVYEMRAYPAPVDTSKPLCEMREAYTCVGTVTVSGDVATITAVHGEITAAGLADLDAALRAEGVRTVMWERHRKDGSIKPVVRHL